MSERVNGAPRARTAGIVAERLPEQTLVYDAARGEVHCLNRVAALVWDACDGLTPAPEIRNRLASESGLSLADETVRDALDELGAKELLEAPAHLIGGRLSRRSLLLGAGALAAITTLVIPGFSAAQGVPGPTLPPTTTPPTTLPQRRHLDTRLHPLRLRPPRHRLLRLHPPPRPRPVAGHASTPLVDPGPAVLRAASFAPTRDSEALKRRQAARSPLRLSG